MVARCTPPFTGMVALPVLSALLTAGAGGTETVWLSSLDLTRVRQGWGDPQPDQSVQSNPLSIGGQSFERGLGTHATSILHVQLKAGARRFQAMVGVDDEVKNLANQSARLAFRVVADGKVVWRSGLMQLGDAARAVDVDLTGVQRLMLLVDAGGNGIDFDHADWADARFEVTGERPVAVSPPREEAVILTPPPPQTPRINGPSVVGVRPGHPLLYTVPATGERPMTFSADNLPVGLQLDAQTGQVSGTVGHAGTHTVTLRASNARGATQRELRIVVGPAIALTPPMGWSTWYMSFTAISDEMIRAQADAMVRSGLICHGYSYINIDDGWNIKPGSDDPRIGGEPRDEQGRLRGNRQFPDMKGMCDYVHSKGLRIGIYISPGPTTCAGFAGSYGHEEQDARQFAEWGFDFLKYDWCSYDKVAKDKGLAELKRPYQVMQAALEKLDRDLVYNLCQYGMGDVWEWGREVGGNYWRTTGDLGAARDLWESMSSIGFSQAGKEKWAGPGGWNDPDNILIGHILWENKLVPAPLTPNEQYTYVSLWSLLAAPLIFGGYLTKLDDFTTSLLSNDEVIAVNQDPLGKQAVPVLRDEGREVWVKPLADGSKAVGLFNRDEFEQIVSVSWSDLKLAGAQTVRDLWRQKDLGQFDDRYEDVVPRHGVRLLRLSPKDLPGR